MRPRPIPYELLHLFAANRAARRKELSLAPQQETLTMQNDPRDPKDEVQKPSDFVNPPPADPVDKVELEDDWDDEDEDEGEDDVVEEDE